MEKQFSILFLFLQIIPGCHSSNDFTGIFNFPAPRNLRAEFFKLTASQIRIPIISAY